MPSDHSLLVQYFPDPNRGLSSKLNLKILIYSRSSGSSGSLCPLLGSVN